MFNAHAVQEIINGNYRYKNKGTSFCRLRSPNRHKFCSVRNGTSSKELKSAEREFLFMCYNGITTRIPTTNMFYQD